MFLATPHSGSNIASSLAAFRTIFGSTVSLEDIRAHDAHLRGLQAHYRVLAEQRQITTVTYFETKNLAGVHLVDQSSANPGVGAEPVGLDEDHISIARPQSKQSEVYLAASKLLDELLEVAMLDELLESPPPSEHELQSAPTSMTASLSDAELLETFAVLAEPARTVPRQMPLAAHHFVGRSYEREFLKNRLLNGLDTVLVGPAGIGKTALAAAAITEVAGPLGVEIEKTRFPDGIVIIDLTALQARADLVWSSIANTIEDAAFHESALPEFRATEALRGKDVLIVVERAEEADGLPPRSSLATILKVLSPGNIRLVLTRDLTQAASDPDRIELNLPLSREESTELLDVLDGSESVNETLLDLADEHPLAASQGKHEQTLSHHPVAVEKVTEKKVAEKKVDVKTSNSWLELGSDSDSDAILQQVRLLIEKGCLISAIAEGDASSVFDEALQTMETLKNPEAELALRGPMHLYRQFSDIVDEANGYGQSDLAHSILEKSTEVLQFFMAANAEDVDLKIALNLLLVRHVGESILSEDNDRGCRILDEVLQQSLELLQADIDEEHRSMLEFGRFGALRLMASQQAAKDPEEERRLLEKAWAIARHDQVGAKMIGKQSLSSLLMLLGNSVDSLGDTEAAYKYYSEELALRQKHVDANPDDLEGQKELADVLIRVSEFEPDAETSERIIASAPTTREHVFGEDDDFSAQSRLLDIEKRLHTANEEEDSEIAAGLAAEKIEQIRALVANDPENFDAQYLLAFALGELGIIQDRLGRAEAATSRTESIEIFEKLLTENRLPGAAIIILAAENFQLGMKETGDTAIALLSRGLNLYQQAADNSPLEISLRKQLCNFLRLAADQVWENKLASLIFVRRRTNQARACAVLQSGAETSAELADALGFEAKLHRDMGEVMLALQCSEEACLILRQLLADGADETTAVALARLLGDMIFVLEGEGARNELVAECRDLLQAIDYKSSDDVQLLCDMQTVLFNDLSPAAGDETQLGDLSLAREVVERLIVIKPDETSWVTLLLKVLTDQYTAAWQRTDTNLAAETLDRAESALRSLLSIEPNNTDWILDLAHLLAKRGGEKLKEGELDQARALFLERHDLVEKAIEQNAGDPGIFFEFARSLLSLSEMEMAEGDEEHTRGELLEQAREICQSLVDAEPSIEMYQAGLAECLIRLASQLDSEEIDAKSKNRRLIVAEELYEQARALLEPITGDDSIEPLWSMMLSLSLNKLAVIARERKDLERSIDLYEQDISRLRGLAKEAPEQRLEYSLSISLFGLSETLGETGDWQEALYLLEESEQIASALPKELAGSQLSSTRQLLAVTRQRMAQA